MPDLRFNKMSKSQAKIMGQAAECMFS